WQDPKTGEQHTLLLLANLTANPLPMPHFDKVESSMRLLMSNYPSQAAPLFAPYQCAVWLRQ
ncbi:MAG: glucohydrolase, partial [Aeromonas sobria]